MASLDKAPQEMETESVPESEVISMMGMAMLDSGGLDLIGKAIGESQDPGQVVGQVLAQMMGQIAEFAQEQMGIDPAIFLEEDSFLDQILNYIERKLKLPPEFSDQVYGEVLEVMKAAAKQPEGGQAAGPQGAPGQPPGAPAPAPAEAAPPGLDQGGVM